MSTSRARTRTAPQWLRAVWCAVLLGCPAVAAALCTPTLQWAWDGLTESPLPEVCVTPLVVQLTDDDLSGTIDSDDVPDVVFLHCNSSNECDLTALDGATGSEHWTTTTPRLDRSGLAAGDLDADGVVEIVARLKNNREQLVVFSNTGSLRWFTEVTLSPATAPEVGIGIADLTQDGIPEIYVGAAVWRGSGEIYWQGSAGVGRGGPRGDHYDVSNAADIDPLSPGLELLAGNTLYSSIGDVLWQATAPGVTDGWTAVADFDLDGDPEIVLTSVDTAVRVNLLDHNGVRRGVPYGFGGTFLSQPVVADIDGDGRPEVVLSDGYQIRALEQPGINFSTKWTQPVSDGCCSGASAADLDGDGAAEIIYNDEDEWYILDGRTGTILSRMPFPSSTRIELPIVVDVDGDCKSEIVIAGGCDTRGTGTVAVYECDDPNARPARPIWNQYQYHATNVDDDGTIPQFEQPSWRAHNGWISQSDSNTVGGVGNTLFAVKLGNDVELSWSALSVPDGYDVYREEAKNWWSTPILTGLGVGVVSFPDVSGPPDRYFYKVEGGC